MTGWSAAVVSENSDSRISRDFRGAILDCVDRAGSLKLDELLTRSYPIEEINQAYDALQSGETLRSVVTF